MDPIEFYLEPQSKTKITFWWGMDEIQNMDGHIIFAVMISQVEMSANVIG